MWVCEAIVMLKDESLRQPVMVEEFIALKGNCDEDEMTKLGNDYSDKKSWMSSAQLWSTNTNYDKPLQDSVTELKQVNFHRTDIILFLFF